MMGRVALVAVALALPAMAVAEDLYRGGSWAALASDRRAAGVGDALIIQIVENASARNSAGTGSKRKNAIDGRIYAGRALDESAGISLAGGYDGTGQTSRSGQMVAQISATVQQVLANGDLQIAGTQRLNVNGEITVIKVSGRVRREDITSSNSVPSSRIADAVIDYNGQGFVSKSAKPGVVTRIFQFLGLL